MIYQIKFGPRGASRVYDRILTNVKNKTYGVGDSDPNDNENHSQQQLHKHTNPTNLTRPLLKFANHMIYIALFLLCAIMLVYVRFVWVLGVVV